MTDTDLMNRGRDFLIGFVPTLVVAAVALGMVFTTKSLYPPAWAGGVAARGSGHCVHFSGGRRRQRSEKASP